MTTTKRTNDMSATPTINYCVAVPIARAAEMEEIITTWKMQVVSREISGGNLPARKKRAVVHPRQFSEAEVRKILTAKGTINAIAHELKRDPTSVYQVILLTSERARRIAKEVGYKLPSKTDIKWS